MNKPQQQRGCNPRLCSFCFKSSLASGGCRPAAGGWRGSPALALAGKCCRTLLGHNLVECVGMGWALGVAPSLGLPWEWRFKILLCLLEENPQPCSQRPPRCCPQSSRNPSQRRTEGSDGHHSYLGRSMRRSGLNFLFSEYT